ncbi:uncharacterized protein LOC113296253 [Papaver somniferum]|uniref:uncharacterized protein LOC113296253 n=1 Tax=Papaver somniferum TaxID=3469 RepID=UPI000E6F60E2|nr:uncharacterized protein LOC113296253 [Papaver somniferum]
MDRVIYIKQVKAAWDGLVSYYTGSDKVKKVRLQTLKIKYELLQMESTETISYFFSKTLNLVNEMKANGDTVEESTVVEKILRSLPEKFESKVTAIEECNTVATMTLNELLGSLQAYEQRLLEKTAAAKQVEEALQSQVNWRSNQGKPNAGNFQGRYNNNGSYRKPLDRSRIQCYNYGYFGHIATECPKPRKTVANNYKANFKVNIAESQEEEKEEQKDENMPLACHTAEEQP